MAFCRSLPTPNLAGRVAVITGGSRGIGRECCLALARSGCNIVVAAKTVDPHPTLPGTIHSVAKEVQDLGVSALPVQLDLRKAEEIEKCVNQVVDKMGRIDILINNASALWWQDIKDTPISKFDLINSINSRGTFAMTKACLPHMEKVGFGRVINMSPPITVDGYAGRTAYNMSKYGMTMVALGVAEEYKDSNITANTLWPATIIESLASKNFKLGHPSTWRKADILSDCVLQIVAEDKSFTGNMLIDDVYLRQKGLTDEDFKVYRVDPEVEPPRLLAGESGGTFVKRGNVRQLDKDIEKTTSKL